MVDIRPFTVSLPPSLPCRCEGHGCTPLQEMGIGEALWRHRTCTEIRLVSTGCDWVVGKAVAYRTGIAQV